jgi:hypothetical protein
MRPLPCAAAILLEAIVESLTCVCQVNETLSGSRCFQNIYGSGKLFHNDEEKLWGWSLIDAPVIRKQAATVSQPSQSLIID